MELAESIRPFREAGVRFVVIGGLAMNAHGSSHITSDVDLAYAVEPENVERLAEVLGAIHARILGRPAYAPITILPSTLLKVRFLNLSTDVGAVDVLREIPGVDSFDGLWQRAVVADLGGGLTVRVASLDDLISMKRAVSRPKDVGHLYELLALKKLRDGGMGTPG
jgi:predicted nucleotidyltransferase